ncbi:MAG: Uma2 family endonuclease [Oscillochloridaceae bacterium umkhey_bin13]
MSVETQPINTRLAVPDSPIWRLSIAQYHQMLQSGILTDDDPVELLEGWLVTKMPKNPPHRLTTQLLREALAQVVPAGWYVDAQEPITTFDSEPEPDVVIVRGARRDYRDRHPGPADVALVVEVADTTLQRDRSTKQRLYAAAGITTYWIVNLPEAQLEVYREPSGPGGTPHYAQRTVYPREAVVEVVLAEQAVGRLALAEVLG